MKNKVRGYIKKYQNTIFYFFFVTLLTITAFGLGRLSIKQENKITIQDPPSDFKKTFVKKEPVQQDQPTSQPSTYVASKNGKRYYPAECSAGNRIKEENKVYFKTEQEAQNRGLTRTVSKSCQSFW